MQGLDGKLEVSAIAKAGQPHEIRLRGANGDLVDQERLPVLRALAEVLLQPGEVVPARGVQDLQNLTELN